MKKVLLITKSGYSPAYEPLLQSFIHEQIELFAVFGEDCEAWENAMDALCVGDGSNPIFISTTSHPSQNLEEVKEFVSNYLVYGRDNLEIEFQYTLIEV